MKCNNISRVEHMSTINTEMCIQQGRHINFDWSQFWRRPTTTSSSHPHFMRGPWTKDALAPARNIILSCCHESRYSPAIQQRSSGVYVFIRVHFTSNQTLYPELGWSCCWLDPRIRRRSVVCSVGRSDLLFFLITLSAPTNDRDSLGLYVAIYMETDCRAHCPTTFLAFFCIVIATN